MKKQLFVLGGGLLLTLLVISGSLSYLRNFSYTLNSLNEDENSLGVTFAIYLNDGYDNYVEYEGDTFPAKADGYKYNADISNCTDIDGNNSNNYTLYYNNDMVQVSSSESVYCYIYFDMYSYDGDYCLVNGITDNLGECALVMDDYSYTVEAAKESIEEKGEATTSEISPTITYGSVYSETSSSGCLYSNSLSIVYTGYTFSTTAGMYSMSGKITSIDTETDYTGYYAAGSSNTATMYQILEYTISEGTVTNYICIKKANLYTYSTNDSIESENGMYATTDYDGSTTYFYRGSVKNNYVYFAGFYWRIIRVNGDGSVRMIYAGTDANSLTDDQLSTTSKFNSTYSDPTYVGYKYGDVSDTPVVQESATDFAGIAANTSYYFSTGYEEVGDGTFKLSSNDLIYGTFYELFGPDGDYEDSITDYYTCFSTSKTGTCTLLKKLNAYNSITSANVYYISYASESYEDTLANKYDSTIKQAVDNWYEENIKDKYDEDNEHLLSEYISTSAIFCGDRSLYSTFTGAGYILTTNTIYATNRRMSKSIPSLLCSQESDQYSVDNGNLDYPIALISIDEVAFAGGSGSVNTLYYLYTGSTYWTMSPSSFDASSGRAFVLFVNSTGSLTGSSVAFLYGVRPVINLSSSVKISQGTGTASNTFYVTLD